jgi:hypothetical protein
MRLLGDVNWWAPRPLRWLHARMGLSDLGVDEGKSNGHVPFEVTEPEAEVAAV